MTPAGAFAAAAIALAALARRWQEADATGAAAVVMTPIVSLCVLLAAAALLLLRLSRGAAATLAGRACAAALAALAALILGQYLAEWATGATRGTLLGGQGWWAQRPGPVSGLGLLLGARPGRWVTVGAVTALVIGVTGLVGHAYGASELYGRNPWGGTAVSTGVSLSALGLATLFADPARGIAALAASGSTGGHLLWRLVPVAIMAPLMLGWLALWLRESRLVDPPFVTAMLVMSLIVLLVGLAVRQAAILHAVDAERDRLLARERAAGEQATNILESITDAFFAVDRQWRFTYVNREAERLLQRRREDLLGRVVWEEFPYAVGATFEREYRRAMAQQVTVRFEEQYAPLGIWVDVRAYPGADGLSVYFHDVTERKVAEQKVRESEERYRLLADMIPQHIWTTRPDGYHTYFSRRWFEFTGTSPGQTEGSGWLELLHPDDRQRAIERWQHSLRTGQTYAIEYRFRRFDGEYCWFLGQAMPLRNEAGEIVEWFGTLTDISERKRLEEERERLLQRERQARADADLRRAELERVTESRARLVRGFSHDVRNPLAAADANALLLERSRALGELTDRQLDSVLRIRRSIRTSLRLIDDLLELARAEAGEIELDRIATDVGRAAREVAEDHQGQAIAAGLAIEVRAREGVRALADPLRLRQILANLLSNAVKYAPKGRVTIDAQVLHAGAPGPGPWIAVSVADTGPGIPEDKREFIFQEYTRLDPTSQHGAGIGLAISRRIARLMGGDLTVDSEVGRGSTFTLWMPVSELPERVSVPG